MALVANTIVFVCLVPIVKQISYGSDKQLRRFDSQNHFSVLIQKKTYLNFCNPIYTATIQNYSPIL